MYTGLTKAGEIYLANRLANKLPVNFLKVKIGNGTVPHGADASETTELYSFKKEIQILDITQTDNVARIRVLIDNSDVEQGFFMKELGVYVDDNGKEKLYWYVYEDNGQYVHSKTERAIQFDLELVMEVTSSNSTILDWNKDKVWISKNYFDEKVRTFEIPTIAELQSRKNLKVGDIVEVLGYYTAGDGAGHKRIIANEDDGSGVQLNNKLWANIVHNGEVNVSWFGCKYNSLESARTNYTNLLKTINYNQTINITGDLYVEQNGDNVVTSENLILKGKDKAKLILCTNFEKTDWFLINKNLKNLSFTDLEVEFNATTERASVLFAINGMIKVNNCNIEKCVFNINTNGRLMSWNNANTNIKPDLSLHGFDVFNLKNNTFNNILNSFILLNDVIYRKFNILNNKINNFYYTFINCGATNENTFVNEVTNNRLITNIYNNTVINDDNFILNESKEQSYYCFVLFEANVINYKDNYIEGIKSQDKAPLYDAYFSGNYLYYENNTWKNNLCFNITKDNYQMMKSKGVINKYYRNNTYIIEEEWLNKFNVDEKARWLQLEQQTSSSSNIVIDNNYIDVYSLQFYTSSQAITNYSFTNNKINCKKWKNTPFMLGHSDEKIVNSDYIVKNNILNLGEGTDTQSFFQTFNANSLNSIYRNIAIENNSSYFYFNDSVKYFYCISFDIFGKSVAINNNSFIQTKENSTVFQSFQRYKAIYAERFIGINNLFSAFKKIRGESYYSFFNIIPRVNTDTNFKFTNTFSGRLLNSLYGDFYHRREILDIPKISFKIKYTIKKETEQDEILYLFFSLERINGKEIIEHYNSVGTLETTTIDDTSITETKRFNMYFKNSNGDILKSFYQGNILENKFSCYLYPELNFDLLETEIKIIGG